MKHEFGPIRPEGLAEAWPGQFELFSWLDFILSVPGAISIVTTLKESGAPNAALHAWGFLAGDAGNYTSVLAVPDYEHTYANILREGEWCQSFPRFDQYRESFATIGRHGPDEDEIAAAGLTPEESRMVRPPRIAECPAALECRLSWHRPLQDGSSWHLFSGRVELAALEEEILETDPARRMKAMGLMYNINEPIHPITFQRSRGGVGLLGRTVELFGEDGKLRERDEVMGGE